MTQADKWLEKIMACKMSSLSATWNKVEKASVSQTGYVYTFSDGSRLDGEWMNTE
jgi:hypothetical protein